MMPLNSQGTPLLPVLLGVSNPKLGLQLAMSEWPNQKPIIRSLS